MSILATIRRALHRAGQYLKRWKIARTEQDIEWARASSDAHIRGLEQTLKQLRAEHDPRSTREIECDVSRAAKAGLFA